MDTNELRTRIERITHILKNGGTVETERVLQCLSDAAAALIPDQRITYCDACGVECTRSNRAKEGVLHLKRHALDLQGAACADASIKLDLCDRCESTVAEAINSAVRAYGKQCAEAAKGRP